MCRNEQKGFLWNTSLTNSWIDSWRGIFFFIFRSIMGSGSESRRGRKFWPCAILAIWLGLPLKWKCAGINDEKMLVEWSQLE